jgi:hypothetical protein
MKAHAHIENDWVRQHVRIWIYTEGRPRAVLAPDLETWTTVSEASSPAGPTFDLNVDVAEALADALATLGSPSEATRRHLDDAIKVRDRLLAVVEKA